MITQSVYLKRYLRSFYVNNNNLSEHEANFCSNFKNKLKTIPGSKQKQKKRARCSFNIEKIIFVTVTKLADFRRLPVH